MPNKERLYGFPKRTDALAVDDADLQDASPPAFSEIAGYQFLHLARPESVQVENSIDGKFVSVIVCHVKIFSMLVE